MRPLAWPVGWVPRVRALKRVVFPDWGKPMIPRRMRRLFLRKRYHRGGAE
jgi:hypothetical protein